MVKATNESERLFLKFFETLSTGDLDKIRAAFHDEAVWDVQVKGIEGEGSHRGKKAIVDEFLAPVRGMFKPGDPKVEVLSVPRKDRSLSARRRARAPSLMAGPTRTCMPSRSSSRTARSIACANTWTASTSPSSRGKPSEAPDPEDKRERNGCRAAQAPDEGDAGGYRR